MNSNSPRLKLLSPTAETSERSQSCLETQILLRWRLGGGPGRRAKEGRKVFEHEEVHKLIYAENTKVWLLSLLKYLNILTSHLASPTTSSASHSCKANVCGRVGSSIRVLGTHTSVSICGLWKVLFISRTVWQKDGKVALAREGERDENLLSCYAELMYQNTFSIYSKVPWCTLPSCNLL